MQISFEDYNTKQKNKNILAVCGEGSTLFQNICIYICFNMFARNQDDTSSL